MVMDGKTAFRCTASLGIGAAVSTGHPVGIAAAIAMPSLAMWQTTRRRAYRAAFCYYAGASWPAIPAARNFFGPSASALDGIAAWLVAAVLLASPWPLIWTARRNQVIWRVPLAMITTVIPPLGIIGWASPLTAAGFLFPHTAWFGLLACALIAGALAIWPLRATTVVGATALALNLAFPRIPAPPKDWEGVDTHFGSIAHAAPNPLSEYKAAEWLQNRALSSRAHVLVFPEMVVPRWTATTDLFWQQTLATLSGSGKTILVGAGLPLKICSSTSIAAYDFGAAVALLKTDRPQFRLGTDPGNCDSYSNAIVIRGSQGGTIFQRIPVPLGMWHPFGKECVPLNLFGPGVTRIGDQRAAILICYEQILSWPVLVSMLRHPTIIIAAANDYWVEGTPIPRCQATAVHAWARLFAVPIISAVNR